MPHLKCVACKARLRSAAVDPVDELCPNCGSPLEPVGELAEIVGFRSISPLGSAADDGAPDPESELDAERWLDDGGRCGPGAVAYANALRETAEEEP